MEERETIGFLGYRYERSKHFARPIMLDGSPSEVIDGSNLYHDMLALKTFPGFEKLFAGKRLDFTSGGTHEVLAGDTLTGATSGATCYVESIVVTSGTWGGGDAAGYFFVTDVVGTFVAEDLNEGANPNVCSITAPPFTIQLGSAGKRTCVGAFPYISSDGTVYLILCYPDKIYSYNPGDDCPKEIQGAVTLTGVNTNYFEATYWADTSSGSNPWIILTNGKDVPIKWAGTGNCAALAGSPPIGKHISAFRGHIFLSNVTSGGSDYQQRDYRSDVDAAETWAGGLSGTNDLRQSAGDIQGSLVFGDLRLIFKEYNISVCRATGYNPPFIYSQDELPIGSCAPRTIGKTLKYDFGFFMGHDLNFYLIRKDGTYFPVGDNILHRLRDWANDDRLKYSFAVYHPGLDQIVLGVPSTNSTNYCDKLFLFDLGHYVLTGEKIWSTPISTGKYFTAGTALKFKEPYTIGDLGDVSADGTIGGLPGTIGSLYQEASFTEIALVDNDGYAYRLDPASLYYDATPITWSFTSKDLHPALKFSEKWRMMEYELVYRNPSTVLTTALVQESVDGGQNYGAGSSLTLYDGNGALDQELSITAYFDHVGQKIRMKVSGSYPVKLLGQRLHGENEGRM